MFPNSKHTSINDTEKVNLLEDDLFLSDSDISINYDPTDTTQQQELNSNDNDLQNKNDETNIRQFAPAHPEGIPSTSRDIPNQISSEENPIEQTTRLVETNILSSKKQRRIIRKSVIMQVGKKRVRNVSEWLANQRKRNYAGGKAYLSKRGKDVLCKILRESCSCRKKCFSKISNIKREEMFQFYWDEEKDYNMKRQFILSCVETKPTSRKRNRSEEAFKSKTNTLVYSFILDNKKIVVCKTMFLNTLSISQSVVKTALAKRQEGGIVTTDNRGRHIPSNKTKKCVIDSVTTHITSFPTYESHYNRKRSKKAYLGPELNVEKMYELYKQYCFENQVPSESIAKLWLYREIFNTKFNLTFKPPEVDTCDNCDSYFVRLKAALTEPEKLHIDNERTSHLKDAEQRYNLKRNDTDDAKTNNRHKVITADLQKCLPTPCLTNSLSFYKRKLWTLNYTIFDSTDNSAYCMMWDETKGKRGANEMSSAILKWADLNIPGTDVDSITIWCDNCYGQNKNISMVMCFFFLLFKYLQLKTINQKFLLKGHTHMEADTVHALIERKRKRNSKFTITTGNSLYACVRRNLMLSI